MDKTLLPEVSKLSFDAKKHAYTFEDGRVFSGVTTVINATSDKSALINWSANMAVDYIKEHAAEQLEDYLVSRVCLEEARKAHLKKRDAAGTKGTDVHALVEEYVKHCIEANSGEPLAAVLSPVQPFVDWALTEVKQFLVAEQKLYDEENAVAGTADFFYISKKDELVAGDLKTFPKMWSPDAYCQTGIYSGMWRKLTGNQPDKSVMVKMCDPEDERLKKYGGNAFSVYERLALKEDEEMFLKRLELHRYNQNFKSPND
jgi:hypothetical protein